jgi:hypothetical protein
VWSESSFFCKIYGWNWSANLMRTELPTVYLSNTTKW